MLSLDRKPHRAEGIASVRDYYRWVARERKNPRSVMLEPKPERQGPPFDSGCVEWECREDR